MWQPRATHQRPPRRILRAAIACVVVGWLFLACLGRPPAQVVGPDEVMNRAALPSCGEEVQRRQADPLNQRARRCLLAAYEAGQPAEFVSVRLTIEGDPFLTLYRVWTPDASVPVLVYLDATRDTFGSGRWERLTCARLVPAAPPEVFHPDDCADAVRL